MKRFLILSLLALFLNVFPSPDGHAAITDFFKYFTFSEEGVMKLWKEKLHKGKVEYKLAKAGNEAYVHAHSKAAASGIYYELDKKDHYNPTQRPYISWKWKVDKFLKKTDDPEWQEDDYPARVYVIFPAKVFIFSKCIEYIWDTPNSKHKEGDNSKSPLSSRIRFKILKVGAKEGWQFEERNVYQDYMELFGEEEVDDKIGAIAFMSDSDDTGSESIVYFDEMKIGYKTPIKPSP